MWPVIIFFVKNKSIILVWRCKTRDGAFFYIENSETAANKNIFDIQPYQQQFKQL
jgi:hypothetical protein